MDHLHVPSLRLLGATSRSSSRRAPAAAAPAGLRQGRARHRVGEPSPLRAGRPSRRSRPSTRGPAGPHSRISAAAVGYVAAVADGVGVLRRRHRPVRRHGRLGSRSTWPSCRSAAGARRSAPATSTRERAARATRADPPRLVVPIHWGTYSPISLRGGAPDWLHHPAERFAAAMAATGHGDRLRLLEPGERLEHTAAAPAGPLLDGPSSVNGASRTASCDGPASARRGRGASAAAPSSPSSRRSTLWILAALLDGFSIDRPVDALLAGLVVGVRRRRRLAGAGVRRRADLGADARARRHRPRGARRRRRARPAARRHTSTASGRRSSSPSGSPLVDHDGQHRARPRRRRLVRPAHRPPGPPARPRQRTVTDVPGVVFVQLDGVARGRARAGAALRRRADPAPLDPRRHPPR